MLGAKEDSDEKKLAFALDALEMDDPFVGDTSLPPDVAKAVEWVASLPPHKVNSMRETIITGIEEWGARLRREGKCAQWFKGADPAVHKVAETVNGPLLSELAAHLDHIDPDCAFFSEKVLT